MIRFAVCDDSEIQADLVQSVLSDYLSGRSEQTSVSVFCSSVGLLDEVCAHGGYDFYILDIMMPGMNGLELAAALRERGDPGRIIFLTASLEYAVQSYDVRASFYMLKPIDVRKFCHVLDDLLTDYNRENARMTEVHAANGTFFLKPADIVTVCVEKRIPTYCLRDGRIVTGVTLRRKFLEEVAGLLALDYFTECGVSRIINLFCVDQIDGGSVRLCDGTTVYPPASAVPVLTRHWLDFRRRH